MTATPAPNRQRATHSRHPTPVKAILSIVVGLLLAALVMQVCGYSPGAAFTALFSGATGLASGPAVSPGDVALGAFHFSPDKLGGSLYHATPLLLTGLAVALGLRAGLFNIGAAGQMTVGALAAAIAGMMGGAAHGKGGLPPLIHIPLTLLAGMGAGAVWGAIPGLLKALRGVHEVIATIMLNFVALNLAAYLVTHNLKDAAKNSMAPQTGLMAKSAWLPPLLPNTSFTIGFFLAIAAVIAVSFLIKRTALGYEIRAVGQGTDAARAAGIPVAAILVKTMALSGALAGLAGAMEAMSVTHRYIGGVEGTYGFDGIAVALLGGANGGGLMGSALFFGALANGARNMQLVTDAPDTIASIVQAFVIVFVGIRWQRSQSAAKAGAENAERRVA